MATHKVYIIPRRSTGSGGYLYEVQDEDGATLLGTARDPLTAAADALLAAGANGDDTVEMWRRGDTAYSMRGKIGYLAGHVVEETSGRGMRWRKARPPGWEGGDTGEVEKAEN